MGMPMPCGNTAALNNYELEQELLERTTYEKDQDQQDIAEVLLNGGSHKWGEITLTIDDAIEELGEDIDYKEVIKNIALSYRDQSKQAKLLERFNNLLVEKAFNLAQRAEA